MQWADGPLLEFLEYLLEWSRSHRLFVLALARPELGERRAGWGTSTRNATTLSLEPLEQEAMQELLDGLVPGLPEDIRVQVLDRAEGVPLYAVETLRMPPSSTATPKARAVSPFQSDRSGTSVTPSASAQARCDQTESREIASGRMPAAARSSLLSRRSRSSFVQVGDQSQR